MCVFCNVPYQDINVNNTTASVQHKDNELMQLNVYFKKFYYNPTYYSTGFIYEKTNSSNFAILNFTNPNSFEDPLEIVKRFDEVYSSSNETEISTIMTFAEIKDREGIPSTVPVMCTKLKDYYLAFYFPPDAVSFFDNPNMLRMFVAQGIKDKWYLLTYNRSLKLLLEVGTDIMFNKEPNTVKAFTTNSYDKTYENSLHNVVNFDSFLEILFLKRFNPNLSPTFEFITQIIYSMTYSMNCAELKNLCIFQKYCSAGDNSLCSAFSPIEEKISVSTVVTLARKHLVSTGLISKKSKLHEIFDYVFNQNLNSYTNKMSINMIKDVILHQSLLSIDILYNETFELIEDAFKKKLSSSFNLLLVGFALAMIVLVVYAFIIINDSIDTLQEKVKQIGNIFALTFKRDKFLLSSIENTEKGKFNNSFQKKEFEVSEVEKLLNNSNNNLQIVYLTLNIKELLIEVLDEKLTDLTTNFDGMYKLKQQKQDLFHRYDMSEIAPLDQNELLMKELSGIYMNNEKDLKVNLNFSYRVIGLRFEELTKWIDKESEQNRGNEEKYLVRLREIINLATNIKKVLNKNFEEINDGMEN